MRYPHLHQSATGKWRYLRHFNGKVRQFASGDDEDKVYEIGEYNYSLTYVDSTDEFRVNGPALKALLVKLEADELVNRVRMLEELAKVYPLIPEIP